MGALEKHKYDHRFNGELYPKKISRRMLTTASMASVPSSLAMYYGCYVLAIEMWISVLFAINYWRKPQRGFRRNGDIINTVFCVCLHLVYGFVYTDLWTAITY